MQNGLGQGIDCACCMTSGVRVRHMQRTTPTSMSGGTKATMARWQTKEVSVAWSLSKACLGKALKIALLLGDL